MNANFDKYCDSMSLYLDYDAAKPTDCEEAARLVAAFFEAAEPKPMDPQKAAMLSTLMTGAFGHCGGCMGDGATKMKESREAWADTFQSAINATNGKTEYDRGFRNALRYAQYLVDGREPQYEEPTLGNDTAADDTAEREAVEDTDADAVTPLQSAIKAALSEMAKQLSDLSANAYEKLHSNSDDTVKEPGAANND